MSRTTPSAAFAVLALLLQATAPPSAHQAAVQEPWRVLEAGLDLGDFRAHERSDVGDSRIMVLRVDPARFRLVLANASAMPDHRPRTAREWATGKGLVAAINASMYRADHLTSVGLMESGNHVNNPALTKDNAVLAFDPATASLPPVRIIDRGCEDFGALRSQYGALVQSIRMIDCHGRNVWSQQPRKWSTAAIGIDKSGRGLFLFTRSPYSTHDFINMLLRLPIDLVRAMYVEGGPEAQLFVKAGEIEVEKAGSFETGFFESDANDRAWPVPNVVGVTRLGGK
jgi:uncharacterized protein YigE (DUF2233 family)